MTDIIVNGGKKRNRVDMSLYENVELNLKMFRFYHCSICDAVISYLFWLEIEVIYQINWSLRYSEWTI